jgi:hypothetical protein
MLTPVQVAALYRELRKGREDAKDEPGAADFYHGEVDMRRHAQQEQAQHERRRGYWDTWAAARAEHTVVWLYWLLPRACPARLAGASRAHRGRAGGRRRLCLLGLPGVCASLSSRRGRQKRACSATSNLRVGNLSKMLTLVHAMIAGGRERGGRQAAVLPTHLRYLVRFRIHRPEFMSLAYTSFVEGW